MVGKTHATVATVHPIEIDIPSSRTVQKFTRAMVEQHLRELEVKFLRDEDGDFVILFDRDPDTELASRVLLTAEGPDEEVFAIRIFADVLIPPSRWGRVLQFCNEWNRIRRWPKAYLDVDDPAREAAGEIVLEGQIWLSSGIHQALLNNFAESVLGASSQFWRSFTEAFRQTD